MSDLLSDEVLRASKADASGGLSRGSLYDFNRGVKFIDTASPAWPFSVSPSNTQTDGLSLQQRGTLEALDDRKSSWLLAEAHSRER
jgi:hypothetical protein